MTPPSDALNLPTNQKFGWFFAAVFTAVAAYSYWAGWSVVVLVSLMVATLFAVTAFFKPKILAPLNRLWYGLGLLLGKIVSPVVLGIIFFVLITPTSFFSRLFGRDELRLKKRNVKSYWIDRLPPGPALNSYKNQY